MIRRFTRQRIAMAGLAVLAILVFGALAAPTLSPHNPDPTLTAKVLRRAGEGPSLSHWLGTDELGRDLLTRLFVGGRISLAIGTGTALGATLIGIAIGSLAGYRGGNVDRITMRSTDALLMLPALPVAMVVARRAHGSIWAMIAVLVALMWMPVARVIRARIATLRTTTMVDAARSLGTSGPRIVVQVLIPQAAGIIVAQATLIFAAAILAEAGLSFLGFGIQTPDVSWGTLLAESNNVVGMGLTHIVLAPGLTVALAVMALGWVGDGLRYALDSMTPTGRSTFDDTLDGGTIAGMGAFAVATASVDPGGSSGNPSLAAPPGGSVRTATPVDRGREQTPNSPTRRPASAGSLLVVDRLSARLSTKPNAGEADDPMAGVILDGIKFSVARGETVGMLGPSGAGKTTIALALLGLAGRYLSVSGSAIFDGDDLLRADQRRLCSIRGTGIGFVPQDAIRSLNPVLNVGRQVGGAIRSAPPSLRRRERRAAQQARVEALLDFVSLDPALTDRYPHELSGGMCQRVALAIAIANDPKLLIVDEPTSSLDPTTAAQILDRLDQWRATTGSAILLITHDHHVMARLADRTIVIGHGRLVDDGWAGSLDPR